MDGIQALHDLLVKGGYYTKSVDEFRAQVKDPAYREKVQSVLQRDGAWSHEMADVLSSGGISMTPPPLKKKEQTMDLSSEDGSLESQESIVMRRPPEQEKFDIYSKIGQQPTEEKEELPKSFQNLDYSKGISSEEGIQSLFGQVKDKLKSAPVEDIVSFGNIAAKKSKEGKGSLTQFNQSSVGKVSGWINDIENGVGISPEDEKRWKEISPKSYNEMLNWTKTGKPTSATEVVFEPAKSVNDVAEAISKSNTKEFTRTANADILSTIENLKSIGIDADKIGTYSTRDEMVKVQSYYNSQIEKLKEMYPEKMTGSSFPTKDFGGKAVYERDKEYAINFQKINNAKDAVMDGIAKVHAFKYAIAHKDATSEEVGEEVMKVIDPIRYTNYLKGDKKSSDVKEDLNILGATILKSTNVDELVQKGVQAEQMHDEKYPNEIINETKRRIGIEYAKDKGFSYIYNPELISIATADKYIDQLPAKYRQVYLKKIRPYAINENGIVSSMTDIHDPNFRYLFTSETLDPKAVNMDIPAMGGIVNKFIGGFSQPVEGTFNFVFDKLTSEQDKVNRALQKPKLYQQDLIDYDAVSKRISELEAKPTLTVPEANELLKSKEALGTKLPFKNILDGSSNLLGQVFGQVAMSEMGTPFVSTGLKTFEIGGKLIGMTDKAAKIAAYTSEFKNVQGISANMTSYISSYSDAEKEAINLGLDGWKRFTYANAVAGLNAATEHIFKDQKVVDGLRREVSPLIGDMIESFTTQNISEEVLRKGLSKIINSYLPKYIKNIAVENQKEAAEEVATQIGTSIMKGLMAPEQTKVADEIKAIQQTYVETTIYGIPTGALAARTETRNSQVSKNVLYELGLSAERTKNFIDVVNAQVTQKKMSQQEADEKIKTATTLQQIVKKSIPIIDSKKPLTDAEKIKLTSILLAERKLQEDIENPQLTDVKDMNQKDLSDVRKLKNEILNNQVFVDENLNVQTQEELNKNKDAVQEQTAGQVPVQPTAGVGQEMEGGVSEPKTQVPAQKVKKELPEGVTITDAVDEEGEPDYDAEDALRAIAKKRGVGITSDRQVAQVARDADGNVIGGTFTSYDNTDGKYTFDVIVDEAYDGKGIGSNLLDAVENVPSDISEMNPDAKVEVDVVNPAMQKMLETRGFEVTRQLGEGRVMMEKKSEPTTDAAPTQEQTQSDLLELDANEKEDVTFIDKDGNEQSVDGNEDMLAELYHEALDVPENERTMAQQSAIDAVVSLETLPEVAPVEMHNEEQATAFEKKATEPMHKLVASQARKVLSSLKSMIPNLQINIHEDENSYNSTMPRVKGTVGSSGNFFADENGNIRIDINLNKANGRTIAHEAAHAVLYKMFGDNPRVFKAFHKQLANVISSMGNQDFIGDNKKITNVKSYLNNFVSRYKDKEARPEEYIVELSGILGDNAANLSVSGWRKIALMVRDFIDRVTDGKVKLFDNVNNTKDVVDFFNSMAQSFKTGEAVKAAPESITKKFGREEGAGKSSASLNDIQDLNTQEPYSSGLPITVNNPNDFVGKKSVSKSQIGDYEIPKGIKILNIANLPIKTLEEIVKKYNGRVVIITSDATGYGVDSDGEPILGGAGFASNKINVDDGIGFASLNEGTVKGTYTRAENSYGLGKVAVLIMVQPPHTTINNAYGAKYMIRGLLKIGEQSQTELQKTKEAIKHFVVKSTAVQDEFKAEAKKVRDAEEFKIFEAQVKELKKLKNKGKVLTKEQEKSIKKYDKKIIDNAKKEAVEIKKGATQKALFELIDKINTGADLNSLIKEFLDITTFTLRKEIGLGILPSTKETKTDKGTTYSKIAFNNIDYSIYNFLKEYGDKTILTENMMLNNKGGVLVGGFELDVTESAQREKLIKEIQSKGIFHPLFNAKQPGTNHFRLDGLYGAQENFAKYAVPDKIIDEAKIKKEEVTDLVRETFKSDFDYNPKFRSIPLNERTYTHLSVENKIKLKNEILAPKGFLKDKEPDVATKVAKGEGFIPKPGATKQMAKAKFKKIEMSADDKKMVKGISKSSLVGSNAKLAEDIVRNKTKAIKLEKLNVDPKTIRLLTDWEKGADGEWRYELDSSKSKMKVNVNDIEYDKEMKISDVMSYPQLFKAYPELRNLKVIFKDDEIGNASFNPNENIITLGYDKPRLELVKNAPKEVIEIAKKYAQLRKYEKSLESQGIEPFSGEYWEKVDSFQQKIGYDDKSLADFGYAKTNPVYGIVEPNTKFTSLVNIIDDKEDVNGDIIRATILHEIQHGIQQIEEFAYGGNETVAEGVMSAEEKKEYNKAVWDKAKVKVGMKRNKKSMSDLTAEETKIFNGPRSYLRSIYRRLAGEVEARNVEKRMNMTAEQRRNTPIVETEDRPRNKQIFVDVDGNPVVSKAQLSDEADKKKLIKDLKKAANKAISKVIESTFDTNIRNKRVLEIHSILADKIKEVQDMKPVSKAQLSDEEKARGEVKFGTAFNIQDETAENTVSTKSLWGKAQVWRERIENAGDILRELSSRGDRPDIKYLMEKVEKLRDWIAKSKEGYTPIDKSIKTIEEFEKTKLKWSDAVDSREYIEKFNSSVLDRIKSEYEAIPTYTKEQRLAVELILDLINNNIKGLESKLNEIETIANQIKTNGTLPIIADIKLGKAVEQSLKSTPVSKSQVDAWHGTPHDFDRFTTDKMGTGEGVQAFGWGLYFTSLKDIGQHYAKKLSSISIQAESIAQFVYGTGYTNKNVEDIVSKSIEERIKLINDAYDKKVSKIKSSLDYEKNPIYGEEKIKTQTNLKNRYIEEANKNIGNNLYNVTLHEGKTPDQYTYLDWDNPISDKVLSVFQKFNQEQGIKLSDTSEPVSKEDRMTGSQLYKFISQKLGGDKQASLFLLENGIDGIKYPAESIARGATSKNARGFNYVVFDENAVTIKGKSKAQLSEEELPGYDNMMSKVQGIVDKKLERQKKFAPDDEENFDKIKYKKERLQAALDYVMQSKVYEDANDVQRDQIVRDVRKSLGFREKSAPGGASDLFMGIGRIIKMAKEKKMVTMTQTQFFYEQMNQLVRGGRDAKVAVRKVQKEISESMRALVNAGQLSSKQAAAIVRMYSKTNLLKPESVQRFIDYMAKVFANADYASKVSIAKSLKSKISQLSKDKSKNPDLRAMATRFNQIDPTMVDDIDAYNELASKLVSGLTGSKIVGEDMKWAQGVSILGVRNYVDAAIKSQQEKKRQMLVNEMQILLGIDASDMTYEDLKLFIEKEKEPESKEKEKIKRDNLAKKIEERLGIDTSGMTYKELKSLLIKSTISRAFNANSSVIKYMLYSGKDPFTEYPVTFTEQQKDILRRFIDMDLNLLTEKESIDAIDKLNLFLQNQGDFRSTAGMESILAKYDAEKNLRELINSNVLAPTIRKYFSPRAGRILLEQIVTVPMMFERLFKGVTMGGKVQEMSGVTKTINGKAIAERMARRIDTEYVLKFFKKKPNGESFNTAKNNIERGMAAFMMRNVIGTEQQMKDEFERRRGHIEKSIELLKKGDEVENKKADEYQEAYDKIVKDSKNIQDIKDSIDPINLNAIEWWSSKWDEHYPEMASVAANVYNKLLDKDINFNPDRYKRISTDTDKVNLTNDDSVFDFNNGTIYKKEAGSLLEAQRLPQLPANDKGVTNRYIDFSFDSNNSNAMYDALVDIKTAASIRQIDAFINSDNFYKLFKNRADGDVVKDRLKLMVNNIRDKSPFTKRDEAAKLIASINRLASVGVGQALGGVTQPLKQMGPIALNTLINAGGLHLGVMFDPARKKFIDESGYAIANRGIEAQTQIASLNKLINEAANSKGEKAMRLIEKANELQLKIFLVAPDVYIAKASWFAYYEQALKKQGIKNVDYDTHKINKKAADYAQMMVDRQQNISDHDLAGKLYSESGNDYKNIFVKMLLAFSSFRMNTSSRLANDLSVFEYWNTSTKEDKIIALRSLSGYAVETVSFRLISLYVGVLTQQVVNYIRGTDDDDEEDEKKQSNNIKGQLTTGAVEMLSPFPLVDKLVQLGVYTTLDLLQSDKEEDEKFNIYPVKADEEFFRSLGLFGILVAKGVQIGKLINLAATGEFVDDYTKETKYLKESDKDLAGALIFPSLLGAAGVIPSAELNSVVNKSIKDMKKDASTNNPDEVTAGEREKMQELEQLQYLKDNYDLSQDEESFVNTEILERSLDIAPERDIKAEKELKKIKEVDKEWKKRLLGDYYSSEEQMKKFDPEKYEELFGKGSDWDEKHQAEKEVNKTWQKIKKNINWD